MASVGFGQLDDEETRLQRSPVCTGRGVKHGHDRGVSERGN
jgi:hypothetical protein